jgi:hypothetical protein
MSKPASSDGGGSEEECPICCFGMRARGSSDGGSDGYGGGDLELGDDGSDGDVEAGPLSASGSAGRGASRGRRDPAPDDPVFECRNGHRCHAECFLKNVRYRARAGLPAECPTCRDAVPEVELAEMGYAPEFGPGAGAGAGAAGRGALEQVPGHKTVFAVAMASCVTVLCVYLAIGIATEEFLAA